MYAIFKVGDYEVDIVYMNERIGKALEQDSFNYIDEGSSKVPATISEVFGVLVGIISWDCKKDRGRRINKEIIGAVLLVKPVLY